MRIKIRDVGKSPQTIRDELEKAAHTVTEDGRTVEEVIAGAPVPPATLMIDGPLPNQKPSGRALMMHRSKHGSSPNDHETEPQLTGRELMMARSQGRAK